MTITKEPFGELAGQPVHRFTLTNAGGRVAKILDYGGILAELHLPDRDGRMADVVLGFDEFAPYLARHPYFGALVGRVGNRIAGAAFTLDGARYTLATNEAPNHLHGGINGFDRALWQAEAAATPAGPALELRHVSPDGDEGYPGRLEITAVWTLTDQDELTLAIAATCDRATPVNIVQHSYWCLGGQASGPILDHELRLHARAYTPVGPDLIPTGEIRNVAGTPLDFTTAKPIGQDLAALGPALGGYDHNFVVDGEVGQLRPVAQLWHPGSGRRMSLLADQPGVQLYSGNYLAESSAGKNRSAGRHAGLCLETQTFPDAINQPAWRQSVLLRPGQTYRHRMVHRFDLA
jgi:aldose 1-epimerase